MKFYKKGASEWLGKNFVLTAILLLALLLALGYFLIGPARYQIFAYIDKIFNFG